MTSHTAGGIYLLRVVIMIIMTCNTAAYALLVQHTLRTKFPHYFSTTVVLCTEILKLLIATVMALREHQWSRLFLKRTILRYSSYHAAALSMPAFIYTVQNNLTFIGLANLNAESFQITYQLKIITTAVFMVIFLQKRFSAWQWLTLFFLFMGVVLVQLDYHPVLTQANPKQNYFLGLVVVLLASITSGFAGVYFEMVLKKVIASFWTTNIFLYLWGTLFSLAAVIYHDFWHIQESGFFFGYNMCVFGIIGMSVGGGLLSALVIRYLNNIWRGFASAAAIVLAALGSFIFYDTILGTKFYVGAFLVCMSTFVFSVLS